MTLPPPAATREERAAQQASPRARSCTDLCTIIVRSRRPGKSSLEATICRSGHQNFAMLLPLQYTLGLLHARAYALSNALLLDLWKQLQRAQHAAPRRQKS